VLQNSVAAKLAWQHPKLTVEVHAGDAFVDSVARGLDAGIRVGESLQQDMIAMRLTKPFKFILVASTAYAEAKGMPKTIGDLHDHNCIGFRLTGSGGVYDWELNDGDKVVAVKTSGTTLVTDATHARDLACRRRYRLHRRTARPPPHPRGRSQVAAAKNRRRGGRIVPLLPASRFDGPKISSLHRRGEGDLRASIELGRASAKLGLR